MFTAVNQQNYQKTVNSVNRQNALENISKMRIKEILSAVQQRWMSIAVKLVLRQFWGKMITPIKS